VIEPGRLSDGGAGARALIEDADLRGALTAGWRGLLESPVPDWAGWLYAWWETCVQHPEQTALLDVPIDACAQRGALLSRFYVLLRDWRPPLAGPVAEQIIAALETRIVRAFDLDDITAGSAAGEETV
jgi:hypothetical protein